MEIECSIVNFDLGSHYQTLLFTYYLYAACACSFTSCIRSSDHRVRKLQAAVIPILAGEEIRSIIVGA
jgi:hypothetical protein